MPDSASMSTQDRLIAEYDYLNVMFCREQVSLRRFIVRVGSSRFERLQHIGGSNGPWRTSPAAFCTVKLAKVRKLYTIVGETALVASLNTCVWNRDVCTDHRQFPTSPTDIEHNRVFFYDGACTHVNSSLSARCAPTASLIHSDRRKIV